MCTRRTQISNNGTNEQTDLTGQVAVVTGGGRGIGRAMALALARTGAAVAVVARSGDQLAETVALIEGEDLSALPIIADVTDQQAVDRMVCEVELQLGPDPGGRAVHVAVAHLTTSLQLGN